MRIGKYLIAFSLITTSTLVQAASCAGVYANSTRDVGVSKRTSIEADNIFDKYCRSDGSSNSFSLDYAESVIFDGIVSDMKLGVGTQSQKIEQFCKIYKKSTYTDYQSYEYNNKVVVDSLYLFNQCIAIEKSGLNIEHEVIGQFAQINIQRGTAEAFTINAIGIDETMIDCVLNVGLNSQKITSSFRPVKVSDSNATIMCTRKNKAPNTDGSSYPPTDIIISVSNKSYSLHMQGMGVYSLTEMPLVSKILSSMKDEVDLSKERLAESEKRIADAESKIQTLQNRTYIAYAYATSDRKYDYEGWFDWVDSIKGQDNALRVSNAVDSRCASQNGKRVYLFKAAGGPRGGTGYSYWLAVCEYPGPVNRNFRSF